MRVVAMIQARMGSTRLPGKVLVDVNGMPLIQHIWRRLQKCNGVDEVVVGVGTDGDATPLHGWADRLGVRTVSGQDADVLRRLTRTSFGFGGVLRITADCLFHDPALIDVGILKFVGEYPKNAAVFNWPRRVHSEGVDFEVWSTELLARLDQRNDVDRENVAAWAWERREELKIGSMWRVDENSDAPHLSIDTQEDLDTARKILKEIGNDEWGYHKTLEAYRKVKPKIEVAQ